MNETPLTRIVTAVGWIGLVLFLGWQEFFIEPEWKAPTPWWFRIPVTLMLGLVVLIFALESMMQEMTVRRWATSRSATPRRAGTASRRTSCRAASTSRSWSKPGCS